MKASKYIWWGAPKKFDERNHERKISWLELFYDLVYVAAIGQLTHHLADSLSWSAISKSFLLFSLLFWSWINGSQYYDLHGNNSIRTRVLTFLQMLSLAAVAISIDDIFKNNHKAFAISFAIVQAIVTYLWWSVVLYDPSHKKLNKPYTISYIISLVILLVSIFTSNQLAFFLWSIVLILNLAPPIIGAKTITSVLKSRGQTFSASSAIIERFGLFTIIILAESILGIVSGIALIEYKSLVIWVSFILSILIAFLIWSIYFDMTADQESKKGYAYMQGLFFMHFPLLFSLSVIGPATKILLSEPNDNLYNIYWLFSLSLSITLISVVCIAKMIQANEEINSYKQIVSCFIVFSAIAIILIPIFLHNIPVYVYFILISFFLFIPVFVGIRTWVNHLKLK